MAEQFLSDAWISEAARLRAELGDAAASPLGQAQLNLVVTDGPEGNKQLHLAGGAFGAGLDNEAAATLTIDYEVARAIFVEGDTKGAASAFQSGKLKIDGDISAMMGMVSGGGGGDQEYQKRLRAMTKPSEVPSTVFGPMSQELIDLGLQSYAEELAERGLTVVPPAVHGVTAEQIDHLTDCILARAEEMTGSKFTVEEGPLGTLEYDIPKDSAFAMLTKAKQFLVHRIAHIDRGFRDLAVNPVQTVLIRHMMGDGVRFSSFNCFVKWPGEFGMGPNLGLHQDQGGVPVQSTQALNANATWNLTKYTQADGCLAFVPGSHLAEQPNISADAAVPVEAPRGSLIVFHGATVHGAYPKQTPGLRLTPVIYFRHQSICAQEEIKNGFPHDLAEDCADPELFAKLAGFGDIFPFTEQTRTTPTPTPRVAGWRVDASII